MKKAYLVSGIGNPAAFRKTAKEAGLRPVGEMPFPDHHRYTGKKMCGMRIPGQSQGRRAHRHDRKRCREDALP